MSADSDETYSGPLESTFLSPLQSPKVTSGIPAAKHAVKLHERYYFDDGTMLLEVYFMRYLENGIFDGQTKRYMAGRRCSVQPSSVSFRYRFVIL